MNAGWIHWWRIPVLKGRMNAELHKSEILKNTGKGELFVIFGEPDIDILPGQDGHYAGRVRVKLNRLDVFHPLAARCVL